MALKWSRGMTVILRYWENLTAFSCKEGIVYKDKEEGCRELCKHTTKWVYPLSKLTLSYVTSHNYFYLFSFLCHAFKTSLFLLSFWGIQNEGYLYTGVAENLQFSISKTQLTKLGNIYSICWNQYLTSSNPSSIN